MISYHEALDVIRGLAVGRELAGEAVALEEGIGRISACDISSAECIPPFDNSAMDGFAVTASRTRSASVAAPARFRVVGCVAAGDPIFRHDGTPDAAIEIMTGAAMPEGALDAVVKVEDVEILRDSRGKVSEILLRRPLKSRENVRGRGEDFRPGQRALAAGTTIMPEHVMALASLGVARIEVRRQPLVAVVSTGRELVHHAEATLAPGMIRNSTAPYLMTALSRYGARAKYYGAIPDDPGHFIDIMAGILRDAPDVILTTGAVSMGKHDFIGAALEKLGATIRFHKVAIRPGKPLLVADWEKPFPAGPKKKSPVVFGIPGNPVSTAVGLRFFVEPYLRAVAGLPPEKPMRAKITADSTKPEGLRCFFKARMLVSDQGAGVTVLSGQPSFMVSPMLAANAWAVLPEAENQARSGTVVDVYPLHPASSGALHD
ncbi:MAG: molybdopterin molybdotransferase MoeA [Deltaproteobacteria bacterium]|nr:molybdopterin molybdotransferase MoeA [Deltaproteobacteria bacterium]